MLMREKAPRRYAEKAAAAVSQTGKEEGEIIEVEIEKRKVTWEADEIKKKEMK